MGANYDLDFVMRRLKDKSNTERLDTLILAASMGKKPGKSLKHQAKALGIDFCDYSLKRDADGKVD